MPSFIFRSKQPQTTPSHRCHDCSLDTNRRGEYYMLLDKIWRKLKVPHEAMLCIGCVEQRLGRTLTKFDFSDAFINSAIGIHRSRRLHARLKAV